MELIMPVGVVFSSETEIPNACYCRVDFNAYYSNRTPNDNCIHCGCGCETYENNDFDRHWHAMWTFRESPEEG